MSIIISTEATADYPSQLLRDDLKIIPMGYTVDGIGYDGINEKLTPHEFYEAVRNAKTKEDLPQTSMVTAFSAVEFFEPILEAGNDIIHIGFTKSLSGTYDQLLLAKKELSTKHPDRKITIIDSASACFGEGLIAYYALLKKDEGASYDEIVKYVNKVKYQANAIFVIDDLMHLCRTGRASKSEAYMGTAFHIKPILYIPNDGTLQPFAKAISQRKAFKTMIEVFKKKAYSPDINKLIAVGGADAPDDVEFVISQIKELGYQNVVPFDIGPVIGTHVGAGMVSIFFLAENRDI